MSSDLVRRSSRPARTWLRWLRWLAPAYYLLNAVVLLLLVLRVPQTYAPSGLSTQVGHNSEVFALALALPWVVERLRPSWGGRPLRPLLVGAAWLLLAAAVYWIPPWSSLYTLNEPLLATGLLTWYVAARRPVRAPVPVLVVAAVVLLVVLGWSSSLVAQQAESLTAVVAVVIGLDLADRTLLAEPGPDRPVLPLVAGYWVVLLVLPVVVLVLRRHTDGVLFDATDYLARGAEGFWGALLVLAFLRVRKGRT